MTEVRVRDASVWRRLNRPDLGDQGTLITGNFKAHVSTPWQAYTGMWGVWIPANDQMVATSSMRVYPSFPAGTVFNWDVSQRDPDWTGVVGFLHMSHGNFDDSAGGFTPVRASATAGLTLTAQWSQTGDTSSGLLAECWLTTAAHPTGPMEDKTHEVAFMPRVPAHAASWLATLPVVGSGFTDTNGAEWLVREAVSGAGAFPYLIAYRPGYADRQGALPFGDLLAYLISQGKITGQEWVNGLAFGVEPYAGAGSLTVSSISVETLPAGLGQSPLGTTPLGG